MFNKFKNIIAYSFNRPSYIDLDSIESQLSEFVLTPCGAQDARKFGWAPALGFAGGSLLHKVGNSVLLCAKLEEKIIPRSELNKALFEAVASNEKAKGRPLKKKEKDEIKDEIIFDMLPRAFSKWTEIYMLVGKERIIVSASSFKKAENALSLLRKTIGSLPVVPLVTEKPVETTLTEWVKASEAPAGRGYTMLDSSEIRSTLKGDGVGIIKYKEKDLTSEDVLKTLESNCCVTRLGLGWYETLSFELCHDMTIKKLSFCDEWKNKNEDIPREDALARIDADLCIIENELNLLFNSLGGALGGFIK